MDDASAPSNDSGTKVLKRKSKNGTRLQNKKRDELNAELKRDVSERDIEIAELKEKLSEVYDLLNSQYTALLGKGSNVAATQIVALSKKIRNLTAELEVAKTNLTQLDKHNKKLTHKLAALAEENVEASIGADTQTVTEDGIQQPSPPSNDTIQMQQQTDKLRATQLKLFEARDQNTSLRSSLKLAQKCIQDEIGDASLNASDLTNSSWRGRAQQISVLKNKIVQLNNRIDVLTAPSDRTAAENHQKQVRALEAAHKAERATLGDEVSAHRRVADELRTKMIALRVRNRNLSDEITTHKGQMLDQAERRAVDESHIRALSERIDSLSHIHEKRIAMLHAAAKASETDRCRDDLKLRTLEVHLANRDETIAGHRQTIVQLQEAHAKLENDLRAVTGDFLFACRDLKKSQFSAILAALEQEKGVLLQQVATVDARLDDERTKLRTLHAEFGKEKTKNTKLERNLKAAMQELDVFRVRKRKTAASGKGSNSSIAPPVSDGPKCDTVEMVELKNKLELANEHIEMLVQQCGEMRIEKEQDTLVMIKIVGNTKNIMLDALRSQPEQPQELD